MCIEDGGGVVEREKKVASLKFLLDIVEFQFEETLKIAWPYLLMNR